MPQTLSQRPTWFPCLALVGVLAGVFGAVAPSFVERYHVPFRSAAGIYACFMLLLLMVILPGMHGTRVWLEERLVGRVRLALIFIWCVPYLVYAAGTHNWRWTALIRILIVSAFSPLIYRFCPVSDPPRFCWQDFLVAVCLTAVLLSHQLAGIWNSPVNLDFMGRLFLIGISSWSWVFIRRVPELGYEFSISSKTIRAAALNFALFAVIAIPSSLALRFTQWNPLHISFLTFCLNYLEIFLFIALLEELFFRGFLQTLISHSLGSVRGGHLLVSCLFGLFHVLHPPFPNWRYVLLATVAGWFYGSAFLKGRNLMASSLTHAMVDTAWRTFFSRG
jgi:membrane protease YdiL (CAAX protease family)